MNGQSMRYRIPKKIEDPDKADRVVKSCARVFEILEFFDDIQREAQVVDISKALNYPQSSTSALLRSMVKLGFLYHDRHKRTYISSPRVALLGHWVSPELFREGALIELMKGITAETGDCTILATRRGLFSQYIHVVQATNPALLHVTIGSLRPIASSGTGLTLLSPLDDETILRMIRRINGESNSPDQQVNASEAMSVIGKTRKTGYCLATNMFTRGGGVICTLLPRINSSDPPTAIAIGGSADVLARHEGELSKLLLDRVAEFSAKEAQSNVRALTH